jgi:hypothetical protein
MNVPIDPKMCAQIKDTLVIHNRWPFYFNKLVGRAKKQESLKKNVVEKF